MVTDRIAPSKTATATIDRTHQREPTTIQGGQSDKSKGNEIHEASYLAAARAATQLLSHLTQTRGVIEKTSYQEEEEEEGEEEKVEVVQRQVELWRMGEARGKAATMSSE